MPQTTTTRVQELVQAVSKETYRSFQAWLVGLPTRHSLSPHYVTAVTWAVGLLRDMHYQVEKSPIRVNNGTCFNVIADRPGIEGGNSDLILITAHLDSIGSRSEPDNLNIPAPGADDNGSGSAGVLEIARVFAGYRTKHDLRLILFGGEEQGLLGSRQYVHGLSASERERIRAVINMDMIGTKNTSSPTVMLEGAPVSEGLIRELTEAATSYTSLQVETSLSPYDSDHVPFINSGLPAVLTIEGNDRSNSHYHTDQDTLDYIDYAMALDIVRMIAAFAATKLELVES